MRREGFELSVSPPRVVYREEGGHKLEPLEEVICEIEEEQAGSVIEASTFSFCTRHQCPTEQYLLELMQI